jgi:hypothetical protein
MLRWLVGDDIFFQACNQYLYRLDNIYGFGTTQELQDAFESLSGLDLDEFFDDWYFGEGYPSYQLQWQHAGDSITFWLSQQTSHASVDFFEMPVPVHIIQNLVTTKLVLPHTSQNQKFTFYIGSEEVDYLYVDPDKWLLAKVSSIQEIPTSVSDFQNGIDITMWPNPTDEVLYFKTQSIISHVEAIDGNGMVVTLPVAADQISLNSLPAGVYMLRFWDTRQQPVCMYRIAIIP